MVEPEDLVAEATPDPRRPLLKGGGTQWRKGGGMTAARRDFDRLAPHRIKAHGDDVWTGHLKDGRVVLRPLSAPTVEVQKDGTTIYKIRYDA